MAKTHLQIGHTKRIEGLVSGVQAGFLLSKAGWTGVVVKDVVGTSESNVNPFGRSPEGSAGEGIADMQVEDCHKLVDEDYPGAPLAEGDKVKIGAESTIGTGITSASGVMASAGAGDVIGHVWEVLDVEDGVQYVSVKLLGHPDTDS